MSVKINWKNDKQNKETFFIDLNVNEAFKNSSSLSQGAIYTKVYNENVDRYFMLEIATGKLWPPTSSPVKRVNVSIDIDAEKPNLY